MRILISSILRTVIMILLGQVYAIIMAFVYEIHPVNPLFSYVYFFMVMSISGAVLSLLVNKMRKRVYGRIWGSSEHMKLELLGTAITTTVFLVIIVVLEVFHPYPYKLERLLRYLENLLGIKDGMLTSIGLALITWFSGAVIVATMICSYNIVKYLMHRKLQKAASGKQP